MNSNQSKTLNFKEAIVLEQVRRHYASTKSAFDTLDRKAQTIVTLSSVAISIVSGFGITNPRPNQYVGLVLILAFYIVIVVLSFLTMFPRDRRSEPIGANWDKIQNLINNNNDDDFFDQLLSGYEEAVNTNAGINLTKSRLLIASFILMVGMLVSAFITAFGS